MDREPFFSSLAPFRRFVIDNACIESGLVNRADAQNPWFIAEFIGKAMTAIADQFLDESRCRAWLQPYAGMQVRQKRIGLILAGNLPLVGFHDVFSVLAFGHVAVVKMSEKDNVLLPALVDAWKAYWPDLEDRIVFADKLSGIDAVMATGTDNAARHFEYYFRQYPRLLRGHRNGVAVLTGQEPPFDMEFLMNDIFLYFGLGCRNVSALLVPEAYDFASWFDRVEPWAHLANHHKYKNNLDYNLAIYQINGIPHLHLGPLIIRPDEAIASRIGCLHYRTYAHFDEVAAILEADRHKIQCVVSSDPIPGWDHVSPGNTQRPALDQYADGVDTLAFLSNIG